jgi:hypothetical protein
MMTYSNCFFITTRPSNDPSSSSSDDHQLPSELVDSGYSREHAQYIGCYIEKSMEWAEGLIKSFAEQGVEMKKALQFVYTPKWQKRKMKQLPRYTSERLLVSMADQHTNGEIDELERTLKYEGREASSTALKDKADSIREEYLEPFDFAHSEDHLIYISNPIDYYGEPLSGLPPEKVFSLIEKKLEALDQQPVFKILLCEALWPLIEEEHGLPISSDIQPAILEYVYQKTQGKKCKREEATPTTPFHWSKRYMAVLIEDYLANEEFPLQALLRPKVRDHLQHIFDSVIRNEIDRIDQKRFDAAHEEKPKAVKNVARRTRNILGQIIEPPQQQALISDEPETPQLQADAMLLKDYWGFLKEEDFETADTIQAVAKEEGRYLMSIPFVRQTLRLLRETPEEELIQFSRQVYIESLEELLAYLEENQPDTR